MSESSGIAEYVDHTYPDPAIYSADLRNFARARRVPPWLLSDFMPIRIERPTPTSF